MVRRIKQKKLSEQYKAKVLEDRVMAALIFRKRMPWLELDDKLMDFVDNGLEMYYRSNYTDIFEYFEVEYPWSDVL